jgi:hypothetical protein
MFDPVTPLLHPFFYMGALHEYLGVRNNIVTLGTEELVLDERRDRLLGLLKFEGMGEVAGVLQARLRSCVRARESRI